jgi:organic hydroperoxide reductase OsmC/OhrA
VLDEPATFGGGDAGAMPTEHLLVAISSCYALALAHVARKHAIDLGPLTVTAVATYDGPSFGAIDLDVEVDRPPPPDMDMLVERASRVCYVSNTLARPPQVNVTVTPSRC